MMVLAVSSQSLGRSFGVADGLQHDIGVGASVSEYARKDWELRLIHGGRLGIRR